MVKTDYLHYEDVLGISYTHNPVRGLRGTVYTYIVDGLMIDTAQSKARREVLAEVEKLNIDKLFITHHHEDHTGNIADIVYQQDVPVYGSPQTSALMENPPKMSFAQRFLWGGRPAYSDIEPIEGVIQTPKYTFRLIPVHGHADGMVVLYEEEKKWLFSADLYIYSRYSLFLTEESIHHQIASIKEIMQLDFKVMFCCHSPVIDNPKETLQAKLDFLESIVEQVQRFHKQGYSERGILKQIKLKEAQITKFISRGSLSKLNMVRSVLRG